MEDQAPILQVQHLDLYYGDFRAVRDINLDIQPRRITAIIGSSGCGKSTLLRSFNRMNDFIPGFRADGRVIFDGQDIYRDAVDPVSLRRRIGMVFQKPNPFPKSIYENVIWGARSNGFKGNMQDLVESSLRAAALWDEARDKLHQSALSLSIGEQQRLCIARALAVEPEVILMDEPCSALDPIATLKIEDLMHQLAARYTIVIVTHNMQQAARASDFTAMMAMDDDWAGSVVEFDLTQTIFTRPKDRRTEDYVTGRYG